MSEITLNDVRENVKPDKHALDDHAIQQPQFVSDVIDKFVAAKDARRRAKQLVDELYAELDAELRKGDKISETQIKMRITLMPKMQKAERVLMDAELQEDQWWAAYEKVKAKGYSINFLGDLYQTGYFTTESAGRARNAAVDNRAEHARNLRGRGREEE